MVFQAAESRCANPIRYLWNASKERGTIPGHSISPQKRMKCQGWTRYCTGTWRPELTQLQPKRSFKWWGWGHKQDAAGKQMSTVAKSAHTNLGGLLKSRMRFAASPSRFEDQTVWGRACVLCIMHGYVAGWNGGIFK